MILNLSYAIHNRNNESMTPDLIHRSLNSSSYISSVFTYTSNTTSSQIYSSRHIASSGNTYLYIVSDSLNTVITKMNENDTVEWSKIYDKEPIKHGFDVAPDESYLCFCQYWTNRVKFSHINCTDGSIIETYRSYSDGTTNFDQALMDTSYSNLVISEDSTTVYFSPHNLTDVSRHYCRWVPGNNDDKIRCGTNQKDSDNSTYRIVNSINAVDENVSYITLEEVNQLYLEVRKIDFSALSNYVSWVTQVN